MSYRNAARIFLLFCSFALLAAGCTRHMDLAFDMPAQDPPAQKVDRKLLVVMSKEQVASVTRWKPGSFADTFEFEGGRSVSSNVYTAMQAMFTTADFANEVPAGASSYDYYLLVNYKDNKIDMGKHGFADWKINVYVDYELLDRQKGRVFLLPTDGSYVRVRGTAEGIGATTFGLINLGKTHARIADTWDNAVRSSVNQLMDECKEKLMK